MRLRTAAAALAATMAMAMPAGAKTFTWSFQGDAQALDPYVLNETFTLGLLGNVYEGLIRRGPDLQIEPALAERWEIVEPNRWRFYLRQGVVFHNGNPFNADDVVFSADRVRAEGSDLTTRIAKSVKVEKVDDYTVDFVTDGPNPILHSEWATWYIMDKEWAEANNAASPTSLAEGTDNFAAFNANGTGPFRVVKRETDVETVLEPHEGWWDTPKHNLTRVVFKPIGSDATRVAALLSGEIDMAYPVPVQDIKRVDGNDGTSVLIGPELRTIFLGLDIARDELLYSSVKGANPFKDVRVRQAFYHAINIDAIRKKVMRRLSDPSALMISPKLFPHAPGIERLAYDPDKAKSLLAEAGYAEGFEVGMNCPNNRYVNDEQICIAITSMLAKVGIEVNLVAEPKALFFKKILGPNYDTSFFLLGWTPGSFDSWNVLYNLLNCREDTGRGKFNVGGYCNKEVDALTDRIKVSTDEAERNAMIAKAYEIAASEVGTIPLHQQGLAWGKSDTVELAQRADNQFMLYYVVKN